MKPDPSVAETLLISQVGTPSGKSQQPKWLSDAVNPEKSVTWIDTSGFVLFGHPIRNGYVIECVT